MAMEMKSNNAFDVKGLVLNPRVLENAESRYTAEVRVNVEPLEWLANAIQIGIESAPGRPIDTSKIGLYVDGKGVTPIKTDTVADIAQVFMATAYVAIGARVLQVSGGRTQFDKKNFEYVALLLPVISGYGIFSNQEEAYDIVPTLDGALKNKLKVLGCFSENGAFILPEWYSRAMLFFRGQKLMTGFGMPKDIRVDTPMFFKLTAEGNQIIGHPGASLAEVLIATLVSSSKLTDLFGAYRTFYCGIKSVRSAIEGIGLKALHDLSA